MESLPESRKKELIRVCLLVFLGIVGLIFELNNEKMVFPAASIKITVPKKEILQKAMLWGKIIGYEKSKTIQTVSFVSSSDEKTFLEFELGTEKANALMDTDVPVWNWNVRICQELQNEEFQAWITPGGELMALSHYIPNDVQIPSVSHEQAEILLKTFIEKKASFSLRTYKKIEDSSQKLAHRTSHTFVFEDQSHDYKGAHLRVWGKIDGDKLTTYSRFLHVPEHWDRKYSTIRTYNNLLSTIAGGFGAVLHLAMGFVFLWALSSGNIRWRFTFASAGFFALMSFLESFNEFESIIAGYDTSRGFMAYVWQHVLSCCLSPVGSFLFAVTLFASGEVSYRYLFPEKIAFENVLSLKGLRSKPVLLSLLLGYALCGLQLGWVSIYYMIGYKLGFWCPLSVDSFQTLSAYFPTISAINMGLDASSSEELIYRLIGLGLFQRLSKSFWIGNLCQAVIWGFSHSFYAQQPCYARGIELTLSGLFSGWILKRFGLVPCLVAHYLYDAFWEVRPLMTSGITGLAWSSALALAPIALLGIYGYCDARKTGANTDAEELQNRTIPIKTSAVVAQGNTAVPGYDYSPLSKSWRITMIAVAIISTIGLFAINPRAIIDSPPAIAIDRKQAIALARRSLDQRGYSRKGLREVTTLYNANLGSAALQYISEKSGFKTAAMLHNELYQGYRWHVRFFRPLDPEEYSVQISASTGKEYSFSITREEDAEGKSPSESEARAMCEVYLKNNHPEYLPFTFDSSSQTKRKKRVDYSVTFKIPNYKVDEADFKVTVEVVGGTVSSFGGNWSLPSKWTFERNKKTVLQEVVGAAMMVIGLGASLAALWWGYGVVRSGTLRWRIAFICAAQLGALNILYYVNSLPTFFLNYGTTTPMLTFIATAILQDCSWIVSQIGGLTVMFVISIAVFRLLYPEEALEAPFRAAFKPKDAAEAICQRQIWLDATILTYSSWLYTHGLYKLQELGFALFSPNLQIETTCSAICWSPGCYNAALSELGIDGAFTYVAGVLMAVGLYHKYVRRPSVLIGAVLLMALLSAASERYWQDGILLFITQVVAGVSAYVFVAKLARRNVLAYMLPTFIAAPLSHLIPFYKYGLPIFQSETIQISALALLPLFVSLYLVIASNYRNLGTRQTG